MQVTEIPGKLRIRQPQGTRCACIIIPLEEQAWPTSSEGRLRLLFHHHHLLLLIAGSVEQFVPLGIPRYLRASLGGNLPFAAGARKRLHIDLLPTRLIGDVSHPIAVRGNLPRTLGKWCLEEYNRYGQVKENSAVLGTESAGVATKNQ